MSCMYILIGQTPVAEPDATAWARWMEESDRVVFRDEAGASVVSTVFLGVDHAFLRQGPPLLFETMVFTDGMAEDTQERCSTWLEAEQQHRQVLETVRTRHALRL